MLLSSPKALNNNYQDSFNNILTHDGSYMSVCEEFSRSESSAIFRNKPNEVK